MIQLAFIHCLDWSQTIEQGDEGPIFFKEKDVLHMLFLYSACCAARETQTDSIYGRETFFAPLMKGVESLVSSWTSSCWRRCVGMFHLLLHVFFGLNPWITRREKSFQFLFGHFGSLCGGFGERSLSSLLTAQTLIRTPRPYGHLSNAFLEYLACVMGGNDQQYSISSPFTMPPRIWIIEQTLEPTILRSRYDQLSSPFVAQIWWFWDKTPSIGWRLEQATDLLTWLH